MKIGPIKISAPKPPKITAPKLGDVGNIMNPIGNITTGAMGNIIGNDPSLLNPIGSVASGAVGGIIGANPALLNPIGAVTTGLAGKVLGGGRKDPNKDLNADLAGVKAQFRREQDLVKGKMIGRMEDPGRVVQQEMADQENQAQKTLESEQRAGGISGGSALKARTLLNREYAKQTAKMADALERQNLMDFGKQSTKGAAAEAAFIAAQGAGSSPDGGGLFGEGGILGGLI